MKKLTNEIPHNMNINKLIININLKNIKVKSIIYSLILLDIIHGLTVNINRVDIDFWL